MGKRAQATFFIIIALVVVIASGILFFSSNAPKLRNMLTSTNNNIKEIEPIKSYIEKTIQDLTIEGLFVIGRQGGKIYLTTWPDCKEENPDYKETDRMCSQMGDLPYEYPPYVSGSSPYKYRRIAVGINDSRDETWTQAQRTPKGYFPLEQPFAYLHQDDGGLLPGQENYNASINYLYGWDEPLPPLKREDVQAYSIEGELSNWTRIHLPEVLDFKYFEKTGYDIKPVGEPTAIVSINEKDITVLVNYTFIVKKAGNTYELKEFYTNIPYNFMRFYKFIHDVIQNDIESLDPIWNLKLKDENGNIISITEQMESDPPSYKYDVINITDLSLDFHLNYNTEEQHFSFYFIRENRAPDAGTVFAKPALAVFNQVPQTWYCFNFETTGAAFLDPDEDDKFHIDPFPFEEPPWYQWKSRGDYLLTHVESSCDSGVPNGAPIVDGKIYYHNDPDNTAHGLSAQFNALAACGNKKDSVGPFIGTADDVGDELILKVGDQMVYLGGGGIIAPEWYVESPIIESGFGRMNDVNTFRPIKCIDPPETCTGGYWRFNDRTTDLQKATYCNEQCTTYTFNPCTPKPGKNCPQTPDGAFGSCDIKECHCNWIEDYYKHVDHTGAVVHFPDPDANSDTGKQECISDNHCTTDYKPLGPGGGDPFPVKASPGTDGKFKPVCCTSEDGVCHDIDTLVTDSGCGKEYPKWTLISENQFCNQMPECQTGCCTIRGKNLDLPKQRYECVNACVESGVCACTNSDLRSCSGDYAWKKGEC